MPTVFDEVVAEQKGRSVFDEATEELSREEKAKQRRGEGEKILKRFEPQISDAEAAIDPMAAAAAMGGHSLMRHALLSGGKKTDVAIGVLVPLAATAASAFVPIPGSTPATGAASSAAADALVQAREYVRGERDDLSKGRILASGATGAFVPGSVKAAATPLATAAKTLLVRGGQGAGLGAAHEAVSEAIDEGKLKPGQIIEAGLLGTLLGAGFGVLEASAPHVLKALRGRKVEDAKPVIAEELAKVVPVDTDSAAEAARKAEVRDLPQNFPVGIARQAAAEQAFGGEAPLTRIQKADERAAGLAKARAEETRDTLLRRQLGEGETTTLAGDEVQNQLTRLETRPGEARRERARLLAKQAEGTAASAETLAKNRPENSEPGDLRGMNQSEIDDLNARRVRAGLRPFRPMEAVDELAAQKGSSAVAAGRNREFTPAVRSPDGTIVSAAGHAEAIEAARKQGIMGGMMRGFVTPSGEFLTLLEVGRRQMAKGSRGEAGFVDPRLLFSTPIQSALGGVVGAGYGATQGNTLDERRQNMLLYGAAGAAGGAATRIAGKAILSRMGAKPVYEIDKHLSPPPGETIGGKVASLPNKAKAATLTVFAPLDKLADDVAKANAGVVSVLPRAIPLSREFEQVAGASGKAAQDVRDYVRNVLDAVGDKDRQNFDRIVALKRIEQRLAWNDTHASDRKVVGDWDHAKVAADIAKLEANIGAKRVGELDAIASGIMQKEADDALRLQVESGRLSEESYSKIKADNDFYAPFKVLDHLEGYDTGGGRAIDTRDQLAKVIEGIHSTDFHIENPSVALAQHIFKGRVLADKNLKMLELAKLAEQDATGKFIRKLEAHDEPRRGYETVNYFENGKPMRLEVQPEVAAAVKGLNAMEAGLVANFARKAGGLFRFGATTGNLAFQPINFALADQPNLWLVSKYGVKGAEDIARAPVDFAHGMYASIFSNLLGGDGGTFAKVGAKIPGLKQANEAAAKLARQFHESGATGSNWQELIDTMGGTVDEKRLLGSLKLGEHSLLDSIGSVNKAIEEATKMMGFKRGMRIEGLDKMTPAQASEALKKIVTEVRNFAGSPDFMRSGYATRDLNNLLQMFLNARVQGVTNLTGRLAGADGLDAARNAWLRIAGTIGVGSAYLWYQNHRPENEADYNARSETEKRNYFLFPRNDEQGRPLYSTNEFGQHVREYWRIPKREVLQYMGNTVESALDFANDKDPDAVAKWGAQMIENLSPVNISGKTGRERMESVVGGANPLVKVPYEQLSGRDTFRHRDILPTEDLKRASPENQFVETTPKLFVRAAHAIPDSPLVPDNLRSPMMLQNLTEGLTGRAVTQFLPKQQPEGRDPTAAAVANNPLTSRFAGSLYVDRSDEQADVDRLRRAEADVRVETRRTARETVNELKRMTPENAAAHMKQLAVDQPKAFEALMTEINRNERDVIDRQLLGLGVKNGARAQFIVGRLRKMNADQAKEYLVRISQGDEPPLTPEVFEQIVALMGAQ